MKKEKKTSAIHLSAKAPSFLASKDKMLVEIENLSKVFSKEFPPALKEIRAEIPKGQIFGLVGPDAAGKTTLMRLMAGLLLPTSGSIRVAGYDSVKEARMIHHLTGYMPQKFGLYGDLTVQQNLDLYADLKGLVGAERKPTIERLLAFTSLAPFTDRLARALSGGMKQKLGLACALIKKPTLLLLDEPGVGVDPISRRELWKMVQELLKEGISVIWSTAYLDEAEQCDSVLLLNGGELLYSGDPKGLTQEADGKVFKVVQLENHKRKILTKLLREEQVMDGVIQGRDVRIVLKEKEAPAFKNSDLAGLVIEKEVPRLEDAFVEILGGGPKEASKLAAETPEIVREGKSVISAQGLTKRFGTFTAVDGATFDVKQGEVFGLLGPNGAGKSTSFKMLCGLLKPSEGKALVMEKDLQIATGKARRHIGYMAQKFSLYGDLSVMQNFEFFSGIYDIEGKEKKRMIESMIDIFHLEGYLKTSAQLLPLGYKQRLALACATMHHPEILFLDEPTSGVDPITRREFWNHINGLIEKGVTVMITTHFMDEAENCDRIALIYRGKVIQIATPDELKIKAKSEESPNPTLEDAFIAWIKEYDEQNPLH
jgi:ABC-2 type transport system ATP-binding protein